MRGTPLLIPLAACLWLGVTAFSEEAGESLLAVIDEHLPNS